MSDLILPRYPIYIPSKGRADKCLTADFLIRDRVPFKIVVEPQEQQAYAARYGRDRLLILPFSNLNRGSIPARNWIRGHSEALGAKRHWQIDDNILWIHRCWKRQRFHCEAGFALRVAEDFSDRFENVGIAGLTYDMCIPAYCAAPPFYLNHWVYSCTLFLNSLPYKWRGRYNEDTDICLQTLAAGWCTVRINCFSIKKIPTMTMKGGNTDQLYQGDGRLLMARSLERMWPGVVKVTRRFGRPQHFVDWNKFDTPLKPRADLPPGDSKPNEYGMQLLQLREIRSPALRKLAAEINAELGSGSL